MSACALGLRTAADTPPICPREASFTQSQLTNDTRLLRLSFRCQPPTSVRRLFLGAKPRGGLRQSVTRRPPPCVSGRGPQPGSPRAGRGRGAAQKARSGGGWPRPEPRGWRGAGVWPRGGAAFSLQPGRPAPAAPPGRRPSGVRGRRPAFRARSGCFADEGCVVPEGIDSSEVSAAAARPARKRLLCRRGDGSRRRGRLRTEDTGQAADAPEGRGNNTAGGGGGGAQGQPRAGCNRLRRCGAARRPGRPTRSPRRRSCRSGGRGRLRERLSATSRPAAGRSHGNRGLEDASSARSRGWRGSSGCHGASEALPALLTLKAHFLFHIFQNFFFFVNKAPCLKENLIQEWSEGDVRQGRLAYRCVGKLPS